MPIDQSKIKRSRKRLGAAGVKAMLKATIETSVKMRAIPCSQESHVNVDTTLQTKAIRYEGDALL
jgi:IS5 family transposase